MFIKIPIPYTVYNNCPRANKTEAKGTILIVLGILTVMIIVGIFLIIWGILLKKRSKSIAEEEAFENWMGKLQESGVLLEIPENKQLAIEMYKANPRGATLDYLKMANPEAANEILSGPVFSTGN